MGNKLAIEHLREWDYHNNKHHCYYEEASDSGMGVCPASLQTLRAFLEGCDFPVESLSGRFLGRDLDEPNSRSRNQKRQALIAKVRRRGALRVNRSAHHRESTDQVLRNRAQKATG